MRFKIFLQKPSDFYYSVWLKMFSLQVILLNQLQRELEPSLVILPPHSKEKRIKSKSIKLYSFLRTIDLLIKFWIWPTLSYN
jgi:hypothetical protein